MGKRKRVGIVFNYKESWIAGAYYLINLIHAVNTLPDEEKPEIYVIAGSETDYQRVLTETGYPYLHFLQCPAIPGIGRRVIRKIVSMLAGKDGFKEKVIRSDLHFIYPGKHRLLQTNSPTVDWIPDFQEYFLPELFSEEQLARRKERVARISRENDLVVLSSKDAEGHYKEFYPDSKAVTRVLPFAVTHPDFGHLDVESVKEKYDISEPYFFLPNQFWQHKNHKVVLEAIKILKDRGVRVLVVCSGKKQDYRNEHHIRQLESFIVSNRIEDNVKFLGFIDRSDQLVLMKHAIAVIQPSRFEGWSTVVEDAKAIGQYLLVSDIPIHREQIDRNAAFFVPTDPEQLADLIEHVLVSPPVVEHYAYEKAIHTFGQCFMGIVNDFS